MSSRGPKFAIEVSMRMWRFKKVRGKMSVDKKVVVTARNPAEAESNVTTRLWRRASVRRRFKRIQILGSRYHESAPELSKAAAETADRLLGLVQNRLKREMFN